MDDEEEIGMIGHFFSKISVAVIEMKSGELKSGDKIHIKGPSTDFIQEVGSMQIEHSKVESITVGQSAGLKVDNPVKQHDKVFLVID